METQALIKITEKVMPGVSNKNIIEEISHIVINNNTMMSYNDRIGISFPIDLPISCSVSAVDFYTAIKKLRNKQVELIKDDTHLNIIAGKTHIKLPSIENQMVLNLIDTLNIDDKSFIGLPPNFLEGLKKIQYIVSDSVDNPQGLFSVCVHENKLLAGDSAKAGQFILDTTELYDKPFFIHKGVIKDILNFNPDSIYVDDNWVYFINDSDAIMACRQANVADVFPINIVLDKFEKEFTAKHSFSFDPEFVSELDIFSHFNESDIRSKFMSVEIVDGNVTFRSSSEKGEVIKETPAEDYKGENVSFMINPIYLQELIKDASKFDFYPGIVRISGDSYSFLIALME